MAQAAEANPQVWNPENLSESCPRCSWHYSKHGMECHHGGTTLWHCWCDTDNTPDDVYDYWLTYWKCRQAYGMAEQLK